LLLEPLPQPILQSHHRLGQRVAAVILEDQPGVVERTGHETGFPPPDLDPTALPDPSAGRWQLFGFRWRAWEIHDPKTGTGLAHLSEKVFMDDLQLGEIILDRNLDTDFVQVRKQLFPARVAPQVKVLGATGRSGQRSAHGIGKKVGQVVDGRCVSHRHVDQGIALGQCDNQPQVMSVGLTGWPWQRPEVSLPGFVLPWQPLDFRFDEGGALAEFQPGVFVCHVTLLAGRSSLRQSGPDRRRRLCRSAKCRHSSAGR
jgi:hypothetical protein